MGIDETVLVVDNGWWVSVAQRLAEAFETVYYWSPWQRDFPNSRDVLVGAGLPGVERIVDLYTVLKNVDVDGAVFTADGWEDLQDTLTIPTWGGGYATELERDRVLLKELLDRFKEPVVPYEVICGTGALRTELQANEELVVKLACGRRGDMETFRHHTFAQSQTWLLDLEQQLGPAAQFTQFLVEEPVEAVLEVGIDTFCVNGQLPEEVLVGYEDKDKAYVGKVMGLGEVPRWLTASLFALVESGDLSRYRQMLSTEVLLTADRTPYLIDLTARFPWPPAGAELENITNFEDVIYYGTQNILKQPEYAMPYVAEIMLNSSWLTKHWLSVEFPAGLERWVKLHGVMRVGETWWLRPQPQGQVGSVVGLGQTQEAAIAAALAVAEQVQGIDISYDRGAFGRLREQVRTGRKYELDW